jgi:hypothetical protein
MERKVFHDGFILSKLSICLWVFGGPVAVRYEEERWGWLTNQSELPSISFDFFLLKKKN